MAYETILVRETEGQIAIVFNRPERGNSFNRRLLTELNEALDQAERSSSCRLVTLEGQGGVFCTGLDFEEVLRLDSESHEHRSASYFMKTLARLSLMPRIVVASIDGQVSAGGIGFVAASDYVIASPRSRFTLPEAIWGLVPACAGLYLARRCGVQTAYRMALTGEQLTAERALACQLVDELADAPDDGIRRLGVRASRLDPATIDRIKRYFRELGPLDDVREGRAVAETDRLLTDARARQAIADFVVNRRFPWNR
jgi:polyketide biosynthesis enoyl-CoA hydratase PksH